MGRHDQQCSICASPKPVLDAINMELSKPPTERMKLRDLEKICSFSKSTLSKHSRRCLARHALLQHRDKRKLVGNPNNYQLIVTGLHPDRPDLDQVPDPNDPRPIIKLRVTYKKAAVRNPIALYDEALAEDRARTAAKRTELTEIPADVLDKRPN
jgi:hypothetical protein